MKRRLAVLTTDEALLERIRAAVPEHWGVVPATSLESLGDWNDVLLYRFLLLDLDELEAFDPLDVIRMLRMEYQINTPVLCFGGDEDIQDEMRLARADRFFSREEIVDKVPQFAAQYDWGE